MIEDRYIYNGNIIFSYRLQQAMKSSMLQNVSLKNEIVIYRKIIFAVDIHHKATELVFK